MSVFTVQNNKNESVKASERKATPAQPAVARKRSAVGSSSSYVRRLLGLSGVLTFLLVWDVVPRLGLIDGQYFPPALEVLQTLFVTLTDPDFWTALRQTMTSWAIGLILATTSAAVLGFLIGSSYFLKKLTHSTIEFLRPIPSVALVPLAVLLFGVQMESALMLIIYACFWQVLIQVLYGVADIDVVAKDTARTYGMSRWARTRYVAWPTALPYLMTGIRLAATVALVLAITAELVIGVPGLGRLIALAQSSGAVTSMYALVLVTGLIGVTINLLMRAIEKRLLGWHSSVRSEGIA